MTNALQTIETMTFPIARKASERSTIQAPKFAEWCKAQTVPINPKKATKADHDSYNIEVAPIKAQIKAAAALIVSSSEFLGKKLQVWTDAAGNRQMGVTCMAPAIAPVKVKTAADIQAEMAALQAELDKALAVNV